MSINLISRRALLKSSAAAAAVAGGPRLGWAQDEEPVLNYGSHGGILEDVLRDTVFAPFTRETGIEVRTTPYPNLARVQAMVQTNTVDIDIWEADGKDMWILGDRNLLEPINYDWLPNEFNEDLIPGALAEYGVGDILWGSGIVYNRDALGSEPPKNWADFWDAEAFPGPRSLPEAAYLVSPIEVALLADGVAPNELYPLDVERAFTSLDRIKPHIVKWWATSAEGLNLVTSRNSDLGMITLGRLITMKHQGEDPGIDIVFNQVVVKAAYLCIPKGAAHNRNAHRFIEFFCDPRNQAAFLNAYPAYGSTNLKTAELLNPDALAQSIAAPERRDSLVMINDGWWAEEDESGKSNYEKVVEHWRMWVAR